MRNQKLSPTTKQKTRRLCESGLGLAKAAKQLEHQCYGARNAIFETGGTIEDNTFLFRFSNCVDAHYPLAEYQGIFP